MLRSWKRKCWLLVSVVVSVWLGVHVFLEYFSTSAGGFRRAGDATWVEAERILHDRQHQPRSRLVVRHHVTTAASLNVSQLVAGLVDVPQRYLRPPEILDLGLSSRFNGTDSCEFYTSFNRSHTYHVPDDSREYYRLQGTVTCFVEGTESWTSDGCRCRPGWHGVYCSFPESVWNSANCDGQCHGHKLIRRLEPRLTRPRRIIHGFPFNTEFSMLEARLAELADVVDVFLILESNYTAYGHYKPLRLLEKLCQGKLKDYAHKIVHVWLDHFPRKALVNGWIADRMHRTYLSQHGLAHLLKNVRHDDLFVVADADELPERETLLFLKTHDGYPEPIAHTYRTSVFGFFWISDHYHIISSTVSVGLLTHVLDNDAYDIRLGDDAIINKQSRISKLHAYMKTHKDARIRYWVFGNPSRPSGWHCSWCSNPDGIRNKLVSAQNGDFPRWGDYPEKLKQDYLEHLIASGTWFDNNMKFKKNMDKERYAPLYFLAHYDIYRDLLENNWVDTNYVLSDVGTNRRRKIIHPR